MGAVGDGSLPPLDGLGDTRVLKSIGIPPRFSGVAEGDSPCRRWSSLTRWSISSDGSTAKAERAELIGKWATNVTDYVAADGSDKVAVTADIHDVAGLQAALTSPSPRRRCRGGAPRRDPPVHGLHREVVGHNHP